MNELVPSEFQTLEFSDNSEFEKIKNQTGWFFFEMLKSGDTLCRIFGRNGPGRSYSFNCQPGCASIDSIPHALWVY